MELIKKYFSDLTPLQLKQFKQLDELYREWNEKINVVSRKDIDNLYIHHVLHSLSIAKVIQFKPESLILDVGTGGGFPTIPLAILFPEVRFHAVDSIAKKITVANAVAEAIELKNVITQQERVENLDAKYDFVVSRGVTSLKELYGWTSKKFLKANKNDFSNGIICLKGGDSLIEEIGEVKNHVKTWLISDFFEEEYFFTKKVVYLKA